MEKLNTPLVKVIQRNQIPSPPPDFIENLKNKKVIAVVGSGLSIAVGGPSWENLLFNLVGQACEIHPEASGIIKDAFILVQNKQYLAAASLLKKIFGNYFYKLVAYEISHTHTIKPREKIKGDSGSLIEQLFECYSKPERRDLTPSISHRLLTQLPFRGIITTNYDKLLEKAAPDDKKSLVFTRSTLYLSDKLRDSPWFVLKIHGCVDTPRDIVLSQDDYSEVLFAGNFMKNLKALFQNYEVFWIGYGHNDLTLDLTIDELRIITEKNGGIALVKNGNEILKDRFEKADIHPLWVDDYSHFELFLRKLAEETDSPLIFTITTHRNLFDEKYAEYYGKGLAWGLERFGRVGDFQFFNADVSSGSVYLEAKASTICKYRELIARNDPVNLLLLREMEIISFDGQEIKFKIGLPDPSINKSTMHNYRGLIDQENPEVLGLLSLLPVKQYDRLGEESRTVVIDPVILDLLTQSQEACKKMNVRFRTPHLFKAILKSTSKVYIKDRFTLCDNELFYNLERLVEEYVDGHQKPKLGKEYKDFNLAERDEVRIAGIEAIREGADQISARHLVIGILISVNAISNYVRTKLNPIQFAQLIAYLRQRDKESTTTLR